MNAEATELDPGRVYTLALADALRHVRCARTAIAAAAEAEPPSDRHNALSTLHALLADAQQQLERVAQ